MTQPTLRTARLTMRPFREDDVPALHAIFTNREAMRYFGDPHISLDDTRGLVTATMNGDPKGTCDFVIDADGRVIGKAGMWREGEIGFILNPSFHRRGYATEALTAVLDHLFLTRQEPRLYADSDPRNLPALALLKRLGFRECGRAERTICIGGEWCDSVYLDQMRDDWRSR